MNDRQLVMRRTGSFLAVCFALAAIAWAHFRASFPPYSMIVIAIGAWVGLGLIFWSGGMRRQP